METNNRQSIHAGEPPRSVIAVIDWLAGGGTFGAGEAASLAQSCGPLRRLKG
jgi:hypothetical protein